MKEIDFSIALLTSHFCFASGGSGRGACTRKMTLRAFRVTVVLVQLNVAVTDNKGNYVSGLKPEDFVISEDKIPKKLATFEEGNGPRRLC